MSYGESLLARGEHIIYRGRQHWLAPLSDSLRPIVMVLAGLVLWFLSGPISFISTLLFLVALVLILAGIVWISIVYLTWRAQEYLITNRRVLKVEGLLDKKTADSALDKINDAVLSQGLLARILRYGDLEIMTAAEIAVDRYEMLAHAVDFKKAMLDSKNLLEYGSRAYGGPGGETAPAPPPAAPVSDEMEAKLDRLADLLRRGKITQADYDKKKAELLDRM
jgi:uncharacterized membrane protein YdbT with pleckstrin-like domain